MSSGENRLEIASEAGGTKNFDAYRGGNKFGV